jgi:hypothetical protein
VLDGYNTTVFAYGQTGSGKTYTMAGEAGAEGLIPKTIEHIYKTMADNADHCEYTVKGSLVELYMSQPIDLLNVRVVDQSEKKVEFKGATDGKRDRKTVISLKMRFDKGQEEFVYDDLTEETCGTPAEMHALFAKGSEQRHTAQTAMNTDSSRSHLIFSIKVESVNKGTKLASNGKLVLVDLAGSERLKKSLSTGDREKEAIEINKSLTALCDVIEALTKGAKIVPYRNHKLTQVLRDSLGGTAKTLMFVNVSPASSNTDETVNSLRYAERVKKVENKGSRPKTSPREPEASPRGR